MQATSFSQMDSETHGVLEGEESNFDPFLLSHIANLLFSNSFIRSFLYILTCRVLEDISDSVVALYTEQGTLY